MSWFGRKPDATPTLDSLQFDASGWKYHGEQQPNPMRVWETPEHDAVSLHFFAVAPDRPACTSVAELTRFYEQSLKGSAAKVVECRLTQVAGCAAVRLIIKAPQKPSGMMYQGALTLPFRDFSFVVKVQCPEVGMTGVREAILFDERRAAGEMPAVGGAGPVFPGWNPDAPEHDARFPNHPISRLRRLLDRIAQSATMDETVRRLPGFRLPEDE